MGGRRRLPKPLSVLTPCLVVLAVVAVHLSAPARAKCLARLDTHPAEFDACQRGTLCFLFLSEPPMVMVDGVEGAAAPPATAAAAPPGIRSPFRCAEAGSKFGLTGASFDLHGPGGLWPSNTDLCVYAGSPEECTFAAMVAYLPNVKKPGHPAYGMALGTAGMLVQVVDRLKLAVPSIPIYEVRAVSSVFSAGVASRVGKRPLPALRSSPVLTESVWFLLCLVTRRSLSVRGFVSRLAQDQLFLVQRKSERHHGPPIFVRPLDGPAWRCVGVALSVVYLVIFLASACIPHALNAGSVAGNAQLWGFNLYVGRPRPTATAP